MGVVGDLWTIVKDIGTGVGKGLSWVGTTLKDNKGNIIEFAKTIFGMIKDDGGMEFTEFKVSMVAPSGFGKTTLLATIMNDAENGLDNPTAGLTLKYKDEDDKKRISDVRKAMNNAILAGKAGFTGKVDAKLAGTGEPKKFDFYYHLAKDADSIDQPFSIMDIPGGWINPDNRISGEMENKWEEFKEHLRASRLLFVPIDATLIMEYGTDKERGTAVKILDNSSTSDLIKEWAKYRKGSDKSSALIFVPIKCEKYRSKAKELEERVKQFYAYTASQVHDICSDIQQYYIPLETLGCVEFAHGTWRTEVGKEEFQAEFRMAGDESRRIKNVDQIFSMIASMAGEELQKIKNTLNWKVNGKNVRLGCLSTVFSLCGLISVFLWVIPIAIILYILGIIAYILSRTKKIVSPEEIINALLSYKENSGVAARRITWWE